MKKSIDWKQESKRFDAVAEIYDIYRPSYPPQLIDTILKKTDIQPNRPILEIGSGTGIATRQFAQHGLSLLCLEPGQNLMAVAQKNFHHNPQINFANARFEDWDPGEAKFDLIYSAQAFHWVPKEIALSKTSALLNDQGHLAIFWNRYPGLEGEIGRELDQVYLEYVPEIANPSIITQASIDALADWLHMGGYYEEVTIHTFPWSRVYNVHEYIGLLNTYSDHLRISEQQRLNHFAAVAEVIERHGGTIERPYLAVLYLAK